MKFEEAKTFDTSTSPTFQLLRIRCAPALCFVQFRTSVSCGMGIFASTRSQDEGVQLVQREPVASGEESYRLNPRMGSHRLRDLHDVRKHGSYRGVILQVILASWRARELDPRRRVAGVEHVVPDRVGVLASVAKSKPAKTHMHARPCALARTPTHPKR